MLFRFLGVLLVLILALFLQIFFGDLTGIWINFALAALITATFFLDFLAVVFLTLLAVLVLNWQPAISWELLVFSGIPLVTFPLKKLLPFQPWLNNLILVFSGLCLFYLLVDFRFIFQHSKFFAVDLALALLFGLLAFFVQGMLSPKKQE